MFIPCDICLCYNHLQSQSATVLLRVCLSVVLYIFVVPQSSYLLFYDICFMIFMLCTPPPSIIISVYSLCSLCTHSPAPCLVCNRVESSYFVYDQISQFLTLFYKFSLTSLMPASFCTLFSDPLVFTHCLYDFVYSLSPIKSSFVSTLCTWVLTLSNPLHQSLTDSGHFYIAHRFYD